MTDPHPLAVELYAVMLKAQHDVGDSPISEALAMLGANTGLNKFRHAASYVRGTVSGRTAIDDGEALHRIARFSAKRRREAVGIVTRQMEGPEASAARIEATERRLRRKLAQNETDKMVLSANSIP
jgi:hypothetical protein